MFKDLNELVARPVHVALSSMVTDELMALAIRVSCLSVACRVMSGVRFAQVERTSVRRRRGG